MRSVSLKVAELVERIRINRERRWLRKHEHVWIVYNHTDAICLYIRCSAILKDYRNGSRVS